MVDYTITGDARPLPRVTQRRPLRVDYPSDAGGITVEVPEGVHRVHVLAVDMAARTYTAEFTHADGRVEQVTKPFPESKP